MYLFNDLSFCMWMKLSNWLVTLIEYKRLLVGWRCLLFWTEKFLRIGIDSWRLFWGDWSSCWYVNGVANKLSNRSLLLLLSQMTFPRIVLETRVLLVEELWCFVFILAVNSEDASLWCFGFIAIFDFGKCEILLKLYRYLLNAFIILSRLASSVIGNVLN